MATMKREGKVIKVTGMSVAGGDLKSLPKNHKYFVNLELDYGSVELEDAIELASGGSSVRVQAQAKLRGMEGKLKESGVVAEDLKTAESNGLNEKGFIRFDVSTDFESEGRTQDPKKRAASAFQKMDSGQKVAFVMESMGVEREKALELLNLTEEELEA